MKVSYSSTVLVAIGLLPMASLSAQIPSDGNSNEVRVAPSDWISREYESEFSKFLESEEFNSKCDSVARERSNSDGSSKFYLAGFVRGVLEYRVYKLYQAGAGIGMIDPPATLGRNMAAEFRGWRAGCQFGKLHGDRIFQIVSDRLRSRLHGGEIPRNTASQANIPKYQGKDHEKWTDKPSSPAENGECPANRRSAPRQPPEDPLPAKPGSAPR